MGIVIFFMLLLVSRYAYLQLFNFESFTTASDENPDSSTTFAASAWLYL